MSLILFQFITDPCQQWTVCTEIFAPVLLLPLLPLLSAGSFKSGCLPMSQIIFYTQVCLGEFKTRRNRLQVYRRAKITQGQNSPVNIYTIGEISWNKPIRI